MATKSRRALWKWPSPWMRYVHGLEWRFQPLGPLLRWELRSVQGGLAWLSGRVRSCYAFPSARDALENCMSDIEAALARAYAAREKASAAKAAVHDSDLASLAPLVHWFLTSPTSPKGATRSTGSVTIWIDRGQFQIVLNDKDLGQKLYASADDILGLWAALESRLSAPEVDWRPDEKAGGRKKRS